MCRVFKSNWYKLYSQLLFNEVLFEGHSNFTKALFLEDFKLCNRLNVDSHQGLLEFLPQSLNQIDP